jgi:haloalkane dehalogenase
MEYIKPMQTWDEFHHRPEARALFQAISTPGKGKEIVLAGNVFVERVLAGSILRKLNSEKMNAYRRPFPSAAEYAQQLHNCRVVNLGPAGASKESNGVPCE